MITPSERILPHYTVLPKAALLQAIFFLALVPSLRKSRLISTYDWQLTIAILVKFIFIPQNSKSELETTLWYNKAKPFTYKELHLNSSRDQRYTYRVLQTIQMKLILLCVWPELAVLGSTKTSLKFKYEI